MSNYPVRTTHRSHLTPDGLLEIARGAFGSGELVDGAVVSSFGAIEQISIRPAGRTLTVEPRMNPKVSPEVAAETVKRYNQFLEAATGYNAKERARRLRKSASGDSE